MMQLEGSRLPPPSASTLQAFWILQSCDSSYLRVITSISSSCYVHYGEEERLHQLAGECTGYDLLLPGWPVWVSTAEGGCEDWHPLGEMAGSIPALEGGNAVQCVRRGTSHSLGPLAGEPLGVWQSGQTSNSTLQTPQTRRHRKGQHG